jgi:hypothetical protein
MKIWPEGEYDEAEFQRLLTFAIVLLALLSVRLSM